MDLAGIIQQYGVYLLVALGVSEALALMPSLAANSILQVVMGILKQAVTMLGLDKK